MNVVVPNCQWEGLNPDMYGRLLMQDSSSVRRRSVAQHLRWPKWRSDVPEDVRSFIFSQPDLKEELEMMAVGHEVLGEWQQDSLRKKSVA